MANSGDLYKISDSIGSMGQVDNGKLLQQILEGPVFSFFDERNFRNKQALEEHIQTQLELIQESYASIGIKQKNMQGYFQDCIKLINCLQSISSRDDQYTALTQKCSISERENCVGIFEVIEKIFELKGEKNQKLESLLSQMHYAQLINFDYKFGITTADSMI